MKNNSHGQNERNKRIGLLSLIVGKQLTSSQLSKQYFAKLSFLMTIILIIEGLNRRLQCKILS
jgi:hypothetical protein